MLSGKHGEPQVAFTITSTDFNGDVHTEEAPNAQLAFERRLALTATSGKIVVRDSGKRIMSESELMMLAAKQNANRT